MKNHSLNNQLKRNIFILFAFFSFTIANAQEFKSQKIVSCSAGYDHSLAIDESGNLWAWGGNLMGQLGDGTLDPKNLPVQILKGKKFKIVKAGSFSSFAIDEFDNLWGWGCNQSGKLGDGTTTDRKLPVKIKSGTKFRTISSSAASSHTMAIDEFGNLWVFGNNSSGQLGDGTTTNKSTPVQLKPGTKFKSISVGRSHSLAIDELGYIWSCGYNTMGQLGNGSYTGTSTPVKIEPDTKFKSISAGYDFSMAIDEVGNLWSWGGNFSGQLGDGTLTSSSLPLKIRPDIKFVSLSLGYNFSTAIDESGNLWTWGENSNGQLGNNETANTKLPAQIKQGTEFETVSAGSEFALAIEKSGNLWSWGYNNSGQLGIEITSIKLIPVLIKSETNFKSIASGFKNSMAIDESDKLWVWGFNYYGQLGDGSTTNRMCPVQIELGTQFKSVSTYYSTIAIDKSGNLFGCGSTGLPYSIRSSKLKIMSNLKFKSISEGNMHSLAIDESGNIWACGDNRGGQLGDGTTTENYMQINQIISEVKFKSVSARSYHSLAIDESGYLWAWGDNWYGQLGDGTKEDKSTPVKIKSNLKFNQISAGEFYSMAIDESGNLWAWGRNHLGQLGDGTQDLRTSPVIIKSGTKFKSVSSGVSHALAVDDSGNLWAWGNNSTGQIGNGSTVRLSSPVKIKAGTKFKSVSAGTGHSLAIDEFGKLWAWGDNSEGQLGDGTLFSKIPIWLNTGNIQIKVTSVDLTATQIIICKDSTFQLFVNVLPANASNKSIRWTSSDLSVVKVDSKGLVCGVSAGKSTITAALMSGDVKDSCVVTVISPVSGITLSSETATIRKDSTFQIAATIIPSDATNDSIIWSSSDETIAMVDSTGQVKGIKSGTTIITATTVDGAKTDSCLVAVISPVSGITLSSETATIRRDSVFLLTATIIPSDATNDTIIWSSSDETIATVDPTGLVTGMKSGKAIMTATTVDGGKTSICEVTVLAGLSVFQSEVGTQLKVYPNPLKDGLLNICLSELIGDADLTIFNANGQLVYSGSIIANETVQINYKTFRQGLYLIKVSGNTINEARKILVE